MGCEMSHEEDLAGPELRHRIPSTGMRLTKLRTRLQNPLPLGLRWLKAEQCDRLCIPYVMEEPIVINGHRSAQCDAQAAERFFHENTTTL
jgi:hypothetical protein